MKLLLLSLATVLLFTQAAPADYALIKSRAGMLVVSRNPGLYFSFEMPGATITPVDLKKAPNPRLFVDGFYLEIVPGKIAGKAPASRDEEMATLQREFEKAKAARQGTPTQIQSTPVKVGKTSGLAWSFIPVGERLPYYCVAFCSEQTLFMLRAGFAGDIQSAADPSRFLLAVAKSFVRSASPIVPPK